MKATDFAVTGRPQLAAIKRFPVVDFADYERRLGAKRARKVAALPAALLGAVAAAWPDRGVRSLLVWPRTGRTRRGLRKSHGMATCLRRDQRFRTHPAGRRHASGEAVHAYHTRGADAPLPQSTDRSIEALEAFLRGLPQPPALAGL